MRTRQSGEQHWITGVLVFVVVLLVTAFTYPKEVRLLPFVVGFPTLALLAAVPSTGKKDAFERMEIKGDVPTPFEPPPGCKFQGRCPLVEDRCRKDGHCVQFARSSHDFFSFQKCFISLLSGP